MRAACGTYAAPVATPTTDTAHARKESKAPGLSMALPAVSEESEHHQEEVDEVEVEPERAGDRAAPALLGGAVHRGRHHLELARVVGREGDEDDDTHSAHHEAEHVGPHEEVHDGSDDHADQAHEGERADAVERALRDEAIDAHSRERAARDGESRGDGGARVDGEDARHRSEERRVGKECRSRWSPYH